MDLISPDFDVAVYLPNGMGNKIYDSRPISIMSHKVQLMTLADPI